MSLTSFLAELNEQFTNDTFDINTYINKMIEFTNNPENFEDMKFVECLNYFLNGKIDLSQLYPLAFACIENIKLSESNDKWTFYFAFLSKIFGVSNQDDLIDKFHEYFNNKQCSFDFTIDFLLSMYANDEDQLQKWFQIIKAYQKLPIDPLSTTHSIDIWIPFMLTIYDDEFAKRIFEESLKPAIASELEYIKQENIPETTSLSHYKTKFVSFDLVNELASILNNKYSNKKAKFIEMYTTNLLKNPDQKQILAYKEILVLLYTDEFFDLYCTELKKMPTEYLNQLVTTFAYDLKQIKFLKEFEIPFNFIQSFISQVGVSLYPLFANLMDQKDEIISFSQKSISKNKRMKVETYESQFQENFGLMFINPVVLEAFINQHEDKQFFFFSIFDNQNKIKWTIEEGQKFLDELFNDFSDSYIFSVFLTTLCQIQTRLNRFFIFNQNYLWEQYFHKCISFPKETLKVNIFTTIKILAESTPLSDNTDDKIKEQCSELILYLALVLMSSEEKIIHESLQAAQFALYHIAPQSFVLIPFALASLVYENQQMNSEEVSILLSIYLITNYKQNYDVNIKDFYKNQFATQENLELQWINQEKITFVEKIIESDENQQKIIISENVIKTFSNYIENTYKEKSSIREEIGFLYTLIITELRSCDKTISQQTKELGKSIFSIAKLKNRTNQDVDVTNRMLGIFLSNFDEINSQYPELFTILTEFLNIIIHSPKIEVTSTSIIEIFADFCLYTKNISLFEESIQNLQKEKPEIKSINSIYNRFLMRLNQPLKPENFPENRNAVMLNNKLSISSFDLTKPENIEVSTMTQCGEIQYIVSLNKSCKEDPHHNKNVHLSENEDPDKTASDNDLGSDDLEDELSECSLSFSSKFHDFCSCLDQNSLTNPSVIEKNFVYQANIQIADPTDSAQQNTENTTEEETKEPLLALSNQQLAPFLAILNNGIENANIIKNSEFLDLSVKSLFHSSIRETLKIGVIFVKKGQRDQNIILANNWESTEGSDFRSFIRGLGWLVDLSTHKWNNGKLDNNSFSNGRYHIYYESERFEVAFHTAPLMPSNPNDSQQIYKKRHVGNDNVHIVWCEDTIDYETSTITSQFNDAHVIVYPVCYGLYRVSVKMKNETNPIGPLHHETIVPACSLPSLVRWTAIYADRVSRMAANDTKLPCEILDRQLASFGSPG